MYQPTTRLLTVLELLQARGNMSGAEIATRLEVDRRSVRRYIVMLQDLGVPIEGVRGPAGGYRLRPGYKLPPLMFTDQEAVALTLALIAAPRIGLAFDPAATNGALAKLERVLPLSARARVQAVQAAVALVPGGSSGNAGSETVAVLGLAAQEGRRVRMQYRAGNGAASERAVDPYGVVNLGRRWYLAGFCHLRKALRTFRIDRIVSVAMTEEQFETPVGFDAIDTVVDSIRSIGGDVHYEIFFPREESELQHVFTYGYAAFEPVEGGTILRGQVDSADELARYLIASGLPMRVLGPPQLREAFARLAAEIAEIAAA